MFETRAEQTRKAVASVGTITHNSSTRIEFDVPTPTTTDVLLDSFESSLGRGWYIKPIGNSGLRFAAINGTKR